MSAKNIKKMMAHSKVHPSEEIISAKSLELGPCIVITPTTLDLGQKIQDNREFNEITDDNEVVYENIKIQSPVHLEDNINVKYTLHSPGEAPRDIIKYVVPTKKCQSF